MIRSSNLKTAVCRVPHAGAQCPERASVGIFRSLFIKPAAIKTEVVVEAPGFDVERVVQKSSVRRREGPGPLRFLFEFVQQHRENKRAGVVIRAITLRKVRNGENGMLKKAGRVGHAGKMVQAQVRQFAGLLIERLDGK